MRALLIVLIIVEPVVIMGFSLQTQHKLHTQRNRCERGVIFGLFDERQIGACLGVHPIQALAPVRFPSADNW